MFLIMMQPGTGLAILLLATLAVFNAAAHDYKVCEGTSKNLSIPAKIRHHYQSLRDRYTNCTHVDGNLEITWLQGGNYDLSFLKEIREVTGYVLVSHVSIRRVVLPNLMIIRGRNLYKYNSEEYALCVVRTRTEILELPALRDILSGEVGFFGNNNLCYMNTIKWEEILAGYLVKPIPNLTLPDRCPPCHKTCERGCWGPGPLSCQKFSKINCSPQCHQGRCFGPNPRECCHLFCAGGCSGPTQSDCLACKNFDDNGVCKQKCPPLRRYNPATYSWESNPDGRYAYGATCVKNCPNHLLRDSGACVRSCPETKKVVDGECVSCDGPCPKNCQFVEVVHSGNIQTFKGCTVIEGSLTILNTTFDGFQDVYPNFTFGQRYPKMHPNELEVFSTLKEVTGFMNIQASHPDFKNLSYFRNLEIVDGRQLTELNAALYIVKTSLQSLNLRSLRKVRSGNVAILENPDLCFASEIEWQQIMQSSTGTVLLQRNARREKCRSQGLVCHEHCSSDGCWGSGPDECLSCKSYKLKETCVPGCNATRGIYDAGSNICEFCDEECLGECLGPGPSNCTQCRNARDGPYCVSQCPVSKYNENRECMPCHENCVNGCTGLRNTVGPGGCNSCDKAIVSEYDPNIVEQCLKVEESCPDGFYQEYIGPHEEGIMKSLTGKTVCRKCHHRCKNCTAYGIHISVCDCLKYSAGEQCEDACPRDHYLDNSNFHCVKCAEECRGCHGRSITECKACRNYRVYLSSNRTMFNCTASCPADKPYKVFDDNIEDPYCSGINPALTNHGDCTGTQNTIGPGGCNSCDKAIVNVDGTIVECLKAEDSCPDGYYHDYSGLREEGITKSLTGKTVCRKCHRRCKNCTAFGVLTSVCDCLNYSDGEICLDACPPNHYADNTSLQCVKCAEECKGCHGPSSTECDACRKYRVYLSPDRTEFNCTASCPSDKPYKVFDDNIEDPYCSGINPALTNHGIVCRCQINKLPSLHP